MEDHFCDSHNSNIREIVKHMPSDNTFMLSANILKLLSDTTRLKILWILGHSEECVCNIAETVSMSAPAVSHHLRSLRQTGIITNRREGKEVYYKIADTKEGKLVYDIVMDICHCHH